MRLDKYHGLGNDYLVLAEGGPLNAALVRALCDRHTGVGGDGVLEPLATPLADFGLRIWNPDGSTAEKSGNGLRIGARWLVDTGRSSAAMSVWTGACLVRCEVGEASVTVDMGQASFQPADVPVLSHLPLVDAPFPLGEEVLTVSALGLGNPHCVIFVEAPVESTAWRRWGAALEADPRFPHRTNVQIARVLTPSSVEIRIWERGAGVTLASGSSACAVAAAAVRTGRVHPGRIGVQMPGGAVEVEVDERFRVTLRGPVERVASIQVDALWLARRGVVAP